MIHYKIYDVILLASHQLKCKLLAKSAYLYNTEILEEYDLISKCIDYL